MGRVLETHLAREKIAEAQGPLADLARLAAHTCAAPFAFLHMYEVCQAHLQSRYGIGDQAHWGGPLLDSGARAPLVAPDIRNDSRLSSHPLVTGDPWVRAVVGVPIDGVNGRIIGALYVLDCVVRDFSGEQLSLLTDVARTVSLRLQQEQLLAGLQTELAAQRSDAADATDALRLMDGVLHHADIAIYANALDGRVLLANPATHVMLSREPGDLVGERVGDVLSGDAADDFFEHDIEVADRGRGRLFAERAPHPDGSEHAYLATKFPLVDDAGKVYAVGGVSTDVTDLLEARIQLAATEERWQVLVDDAPVAVVVIDLEDQLVRYANRQAASLCGLALPSDLVGCAMPKFLPAGGGQELNIRLAEALEGPVRNAPMQIAPVDGALRDVTLNAVSVVFNGRPAIQLALLDVTAEQAKHTKLVESAAFQRAVLAASPDVIYVMETAGWSPVWASGNLLQVLGYPEDHATAEIGDDVSEEIVHPEDRPRMHAVNEASLELIDGQATHLRFRCLSKSGEYRWFTRRLTPFARDESGAITQVLAVARDITDAVQSEDRLARAALHDPLTGLPNRVLLADRLTSALGRAERSNTEVAVLFCDLDGFKHVNDLSGHTAGDGVLLATAARLIAELRPQDTIARVGGDEFVIILEPSLRSLPTGLTGPADFPDPRVDALTVASRIKRALAQPIELGEHQHVVTASIGITFARHGEGAEDALRDADSAMYRAKALGKDRCEIFDNHLRVEAIERGRTEQLLRTALAAKLDPPRDGNQAAATPQFWVAYQPIVDLSTRRIVGVEALARLTDAEGRFVSPEDFIPIAEETSLIGTLGQFVLEQACRDLAVWQAGHPDPLGVSVNLSARQAGLTDLVGLVESALRESHVAPAQLTLELTETALLEAGQSTMSALHDLRELGVHISIDDFGTGYASLRYLTQLPVTGVKVDRSFTMGLPDDPTSNAIVQSVAGLARELSLSCVVEGIETVDQLDALPAGVLGQGYLLSRPIPAAEMGRFLQTTKTCPRQESNLRPST